VIAWECDLGCHGTSLATTQGLVSIDTRARLWREKRVFFCTPQVVQKDVDRGILRPEQ
jgi:ERCC4-related helicase